MTSRPNSSGTRPDDYGPDYRFYRARLARPSPLRYDWWAGRFNVRLVRRFRPHGRLLEIGCGLGYTLHLLEPYFETYGMDLSAFAVQVASRTAARSRILQMDAHTLAALVGPPFDVILAANLLEHLEHPDQVLAQCARLLGPGGILLCWVPNTGSVAKRWKGDRWFGYRDAGHVSLLSPPAWLDLLAASGLTPVRVFVDGLWDAPYLPIVPTWLQRLLLLLPTLLQFGIGRPFIPLHWGEDLGIIARRI